MVISKQNPTQSELYISTIRENEKVNGNPE